MTTFTVTNIRSMIYSYQNVQTLGPTPLHSSYFLTPTNYSSTLWILCISELIQHFFLFLAYFKFIHAVSNIEIPVFFQH